MCNVKCAAGAAVVISQFCYRQTHEQERLLVQTILLQSINFVDHGLCMMKPNNTCRPILFNATFFRSFSFQFLSFITQGKPRKPEINSSKYAVCAELKHLSMYMYMLSVRVYDMVAILMSRFIHSADNTKAANEK